MGESVTIGHISSLNIVICFYSWTKYITQASEAMKKNEINQKKKPPVPEEIPREPPVQPG